MKTVPRVFAYSKRYPVPLLSGLACTIASALMVIVFPVATKYIIDDVIHDHRAERLLPLLLCLGLAILLQFALIYLRLVVGNALEQKVIFDLRSDLYLHIQTLPVRWFDNRSTGDLMTRILEDVGAVERVLIDGIEEGAVALLQVVVVVAAMFYLNPTLALVALAPVPFLAAGRLCYTLTAHRRYQLQRGAASAMNSLLHDNLSGIRQIKSFVREPDQACRFNKTSNQLRRANQIA